MRCGRSVQLCQAVQVASIFKVRQCKIVERGGWIGGGKNFINLAIVGLKAVGRVERHAAGGGIDGAEEHALATLWHGDGGCFSELELFIRQLHEAGNARKFCVVGQLVKAVTAAFAGAGCHVQYLVTAKRKGAKERPADGVDGAHILPREQRQQQCVQGGAYAAV